MYTQGGEEAVSDTGEGSGGEKVHKPAEERGPRNVVESRLHYAVFLYW